MYVINNVHLINRKEQK